MTRYTIRRISNMLWHGYTPDGVQIGEHGCDMARSARRLCDRHAALVYGVRGLVLLWPAGDSEAEQYGKVPRDLAERMEGAA